jgi:hypothetical protein
VERRDVEAAVEARKELGPAYDDHLVDSLLAKLEERLQPAQRHRIDLRLPLWSMGVGIAVTAIATGNGAAWLAAIAWVAIAVVNIVYFAIETRR